jgi:uncharacterized protein
MPLKKKIAAFLAVVALLGLLPSRALAMEEPVPTNASAEDLARQLIHLTGGGSLGKQVITQMVDSFRQSHPKVPEEFWTELLASVDPKQLEDMVVPIYVKNFTAEELRASIQFYSSPVGQSLIHKLPVVLQQSMAVGQEWGRKLAQEVGERVAKYKRTHSDT